MSAPQLPPAQQPQIIYQQVVRPPSNGMAVTSLVLGIVAIVFGIWVPVPVFGLVMMFLAFIPAVLAAIFGHIGLANAARIGGVGHGGALTGLILGYVTLAISVITTIFWIILAIASSAASS